MCVQDIKIGRKTENKEFHTGGGITAGQNQLMGADSMRIAVTMVALNGQVTAANDVVVLVADSENGPIPLLAVSAWSPWANATIDQLGSAIQDALRLAFIGAGNLNVSVSTVRMLGNVNDPELK